MCECWNDPKHVESLERMLPNFDHCKTLYTKCDYKLEACAHEQLLVLESELQVHRLLVESEMKLQNDLIDRLWVLSQIYLLLTNSGVCVKPYPELVSEPREQRTLCEFHEKLRALNYSNCRMSQSLHHILESMRELDRRCSRLDMSVESTFIRGDVFNRPLAYLREILTDLYKFFYTHISKLKCWAQLLDPGDAGAIEDYMALAKSSEDFENYLMSPIINCTCFRTNNRQIL